MVSSPPPILVVSGATGASGELVVRTVLAQYHQSVPVVLVPRVRSRAEIEFSVAQDDGQRHGFAIVDVTDRPVESSADEVIVAMTSRLRAH